MNAARALAEVEAWCANAVERVFGLAFPTSLEPVQIARKIVSAFESAALPTDGLVTVVTVRVNPHDMARLETERSALERQWAQMLARIAARAGRADRPSVRLEAAAEQPRGTAGASAQWNAASASEVGATCALQVRKGVPPGASYPLAGTLVIGRDAQCDIVLADPRVSRRHARVWSSGEGISFVDLDSSNGLFLNGARQTSGSLRVGDVLRLGDTELLVVSYRNGS